MAASTVLFILLAATASVSNAAPSGSCASDVTEPSNLPEVAEDLDIPEAEEGSLDEHVLLLQTGLQHKGPPSASLAQTADPDPSQKKQPNASDVVSPGMKAFAALMKAQFSQNLTKGLQSPCAATGAGENTTYTPPVAGEWTGLMLIHGVSVRVLYGNTTSISVTGYSSLVSQVTFTISYFGTLVVDVPPGLCNSNVLVTVTRPYALSHAVLSSGSSLVADAVSGPISTSDYAHATVTTLSATTPLSLDTSSYGVITVAGGSASYISVSASAGGQAFLGGLTATTGSVSVSSFGSIRGLTLESASISASSGGFVGVNILGSAGLSCSSSASVNITGPGAVTVWSIWGCATGVHGTAAI